MSQTETISVQSTTATTQPQTITLNRFCLPTMATSTSTASTNQFDSEDKGLVMMLDSQVEKSLINMGNPALRSPLDGLCGQSQGHSSLGSSPSSSVSVSVLSVSTASLLLSSQQYYLKSLHRLNSFVQTQLTRFLPFFLYLTLLVLGVQAMGVLSLILLAESQPWGLWFLMGCGATLGFLFSYTGDSQPSIQTPPPSPSHSSSQLHSSSS